MSDSRSQAADVLQFCSDALAGLGQHLAEPFWQSLMAELHDYRGEIIATDVGASSVTACKVAHMLACAERPTIYFNVTNTAHGDFGFLRANDLMIMLSHRGNSDELIRLLFGLNVRSTPILSVTESADLAIIKASGLVISTDIQRGVGPFNMSATISVLLVLTIFDTARVYLMSESGYSKEMLLSMHPGGDVGLTLNRGR